MKMNAELLNLSLPLEEVLKTPALPEEYIIGRWGDRVETKNGSSSVKSIQNGLEFPFSNGSPLTFAKIESATMLTKGNDVKAILNICINVEDCDFNFLPGDTIGIIPKNSQEEVNSLINLLGLAELADMQWYLSVRSDTKKKKATLPGYIPPVTTVRSVLETCIAIRMVPKKTLLRTLAEYTKEPQEQRRLLELCSIQGSSEYTKFIVNNMVSLIDILQTFHSCKPPVERLLEHLQRLQARPYSIALSKPGLIYIAVTVVENDTPSRKGVCSGWLQNITARYHESVPLDVQLMNLTLDNSPQFTQVPIYLRSKSDFRVPDNPETSLIMVGPGTGVAPFIGFLQYRSQMREARESVNFGKTWLFFGCRYKDRDFIYREEIEEFLKSGILTQFSVCFSRDETNMEIHNGKHVKYVQDNIKKHKEKFVLQFLSDSNMTFLCGDARNMAKDVHDTIIKCLQKTKGYCQPEAEEILFKMQKEKRFIQDVWQ